ncbi:MAG: flagellar export protein FliJ [Deltaproteobacteria bacterium]|nr:flagellar export protein FliJ [Deltaproteobacteria bacterium]
MNKFVFKLEPLYDYRQRLQEICQKEFGEAQRKLDEEEAKLETLREVYRKASSDIDGLKEKGARFDEIDLYYSYATGLKKHISDQDKLIKRTRQALEVKRGELLEASKKKKVIEVMKEKSLNSYIETSNKEEQKISDDIVSSRFNRGVEHEK